MTKAPHGVKDFTAEKSDISDTSTNKTGVYTISCR